jgi:16S rRNA (guanine(527)-N(7))-methyltransferase RsmG
MENDARVVKWQERAAVRLAESLEALKLEHVRTAKEVADIGSGAGYPGLALAAALPETRVTLIEVKDKRCEFLRESIEAMALENVEVVERRVQAFWADGEGRFDLVTSRGVSKLPVMVGLGAPLLKAGGALVLWGRCQRRQTVPHGLALSPAGILQGDEICLHSYTKRDSPFASDAVGVQPQRADRKSSPRQRKGGGVQPQRADRKSPRQRKGGLPADKRIARIVELSGLIADLEDSRSRASEMQLARIDFDIQRFVERKAALEEECRLPARTDSASTRSSSP